MNKTKKPLVGAQKFIFIASVGRSGSTFFGHRLAHFGGFYYFGEKRFLWMTMKFFPLLGRYFLRRNLISNIEEQVVLDKTPQIHNYLKSALTVVDVKGIVLLERDSLAVALSASKMETQGTNLNRVWLRMRKYYKEYGFFAFLAPLARFHHLFHAFGIKTGAFGQSLFSPPIEEEAETMSSEIEAFTKNEGIKLVKISYENFLSDCDSLHELGVSSSAIEKIKSEFLPVER